MTPVKIGEYELESLQLYFNASLELQAELLSKDFGVPLDTPLPIIYANYKGYRPGMGPPGPPKAAVIHPTRYNRTLEQLGWLEERDHFNIPPEVGGTVVIELNQETKEIKFLFHFSNEKPNYHLEKASYRGNSPTVWKNWTMWYISYQDFEDLLIKLERVISVQLEPEDISLRFCRERQQRIEETFYVCDSTKRGLPVLDFGLCLGCFDFTLDYLKAEIDRYRKGTLDNVHLCIIRDQQVPMFIKLGLAKIPEKSVQFMFKLASDPRVFKQISGMQGRRIEGKARGALQLCDHKTRDNFISMNASMFLEAAVLSRALYQRTLPLQNRGIRTYPRWVP